MKSSINFLPAEKRRDLHQLVEIIRNEIKDCVMIILYGSYARDMYVDCDRRRDYGVTTFFMSDYDILIVTRRRLGLKEYDVYARITERFFENKQSEFYTRPQFINESISRLNKNLELGQYFYHEIKKQGIMLLAGVQTGAMPKIELCGNRANRPRLFQRKIPVRQRFSVRSTLLCRVAEI